MGENGLKFEEFAYTTQGVRTISNGNMVWFVGADIAKILGYKRPTKAITDHVDVSDRWKLTKETQSQFGLELGQRGGWLVNEYGVHDLILSSELPEAKQFRRWITHEVLPSIRKTGQYIDTEKKFDKFCPVKFDRARCFETARKKVRELGLNSNNANLLWRQWYIDFSKEIGFNIDTKAKRENISKIEWLEKHGYMEKFCEFISK